MGGNKKEEGRRLVEETGEMEGEETDLGVQQNTILQN
jgi:hypothetical protein